MLEQQGPKVTLLPQIAFAVGNVKISVQSAQNVSESSPSHILSEMKHSEVNASADILNDFCSSSYSEPADTCSERGLEQTSEPADTNCIERGSGLDQASLEEPKKLQDEVRFFENNFKNINFM